MSGETASASDEEETPLEQTVSGVVIALIFLVGFGLMFAGVSWFWVAFPVGFAGLLPAAIGLARWYERSREGTSAESDRSAEEDALERLRGRYARGELTDEEFERQVERLLETESVEDAESFLGRSEPDDVTSAEAVEPDPQPETERE